MKRKELNFELNIMPTLDILSVLICFLLLTAVWVQIGSLDVRQAIGDNAAGGKNPPSIWATVKQDGSVDLSLRDVKVRQSEMSLRGQRGEIDWNRLTEQLRTLKAQLPDLKTGVIRPEAGTRYGDVIRLMDSLKKIEISDIGLSPLG